MKLMDITDLNTQIEKRALWWKTYSSHIQEEIRQLRGRTSTLIKRCVTEGKIMNTVHDVTLKISDD